MVGDQLFVGLILHHCPSSNGFIHVIYFRIQIYTLLSAPYCLDDSSLTMISSFALPFHTALAIPSSSALRYKFLDQLVYIHKKIPAGILIGIVMNLKITGEKYDNSILLNLPNIQIKHICTFRSPWISLRSIFFLVSSIQILCVF